MAVEEPNPGRVAKREVQPDLVVERRAIFGIRGDQAADEVTRPGEPARVGLEPEASAGELWLTTRPEEMLDYLDRAHAAWRGYLTRTDPVAL